MKKSCYPQEHVAGTTAGRRHIPKAVTVRQAADDYLKFLATEDRVPKTVVKYRGVFDTLVAFLEEQDTQGFQRRVRPRLARPAASTAQEFTNQQLLMGLSFRVDHKTGTRPLETLVQFGPTEWLCRGRTPRGSAPVRTGGTVAPGRSGSSQQDGPASLEHPREVSLARVVLQPRRCQSPRRE